MNYLETYRLFIVTDNYFHTLHGYNKQNIIFVKYIIGLFKNKASFERCILHILEIIYQFSLQCSVIQNILPDIIILSHSYLMNCSLQVIYRIIHSTVALTFATNVYKQHNKHGQNVVTFRFIQNFICLMNLAGLLQSFCSPWPCALPVLRDHFEEALTWAGLPFKTLKPH